MHYIFACECLQEFEVEDGESLCECLKSLATDGNKHRAKNDRRKQRSIFREVLHYIEVCYLMLKPCKDWQMFLGARCSVLSCWIAFFNIALPTSELLTSHFFLQNEDFTEEKIRFGVENVYIDSWVRRRIYDAFKEILESGVRDHLQVRKRNKMPSSLSLITRVGLFSYSLIYCRCSVLSVSSVLSSVTSCTDCRKQKPEVEWEDWYWLLSQQAARIPNVILCGGYASRHTMSTPTHEPLVWANPTASVRFI